MSFNSLMSHRATLKIKASSQNALGEWSNTYTSATTSINCRMSPISAMERMELQGRFDDIRFKMFTESSNRVSVENQVMYNGKTYRVKEATIDSIYHHWEALLSEL